MKKQLVLMNKKTPVAEIIYDAEAHRAVKIGRKCNLDYAPPAIINPRGETDTKRFNKWWEGRAIPATRQHIIDILELVDETDILAIGEKSFGLSLSDCYWLNDPNNPQEWDKINFFDNPFKEDLGLITLGQNAQKKPDMYSPNGTLNGNLQKKWDEKHRRISIQNVHL